MAKPFDKGEKKAAILEAAIKVFAKKGLKNTRISDIAEAANIAKGTVYLYFKSKDEIFKASFIYFMEQQEMVTIEHISDITDPAEKIRIFFDTWADIFESDYKDYIGIIIDFWAEGIRNRNLSSHFDLGKMYHRLRLMLKTVLDGYLEKKSHKDIDTLLLSSIIIGAMDGILLQWIIDRKIIDIKKAFKILADLTIEKLEVIES